MIYDVTAYVTMTMQVDAQVDATSTLEAHYNAVQYLGANPPNVSDGDVLYIEVDGVSVVRRDEE